MSGLCCWIGYILEASFCCIVDCKCVHVKSPEHDDPALALNYSKGARSWGIRPWKSRSLHWLYSLR